MADTMTDNRLQITDAHCHFLSAHFFQALGRDAGVDDVPAKLGWESPGDPVQLADRWIAELDRAGVTKAMLIATVPGDEASVGAAIAHAPDRFAGAFMCHPAAPDLDARLDRAFGELQLKVACLFPALHLVPLDDARVEKVFAAAAKHQRAVFVHCGLLSIGFRKKLGLPSRFDWRLGDPLAVATIAARHPAVPVIIPHFGAGLFREALMAGMAAPNILLDTSSSNSWMATDHGLTLRDVFARAIECLGPERLLFGTDSSFFPRGWQKPIYDAQRSALDALGADSATQAAIFGGNFLRYL
jgi:hypothetical protein